MSLGGASACVWMVAWDWAGPPPPPPMRPACSPAWQPFSKKMASTKWLYASRGACGACGACVLGWGAAPILRKIRSGCTPGAPALRVLRVATAWVGCGPKCCTSVISLSGCTPGAPALRVVRVVRCCNMCGVLPCALHLTLAKSQRLVGRAPELLPDHHQPNPQRSSAPPSSP